MLSCTLAHPLVCSCTLAHPLVCSYALAHPLVCSCTCSLALSRTLLCALANMLQHAPSGHAYLPVLHPAHLCFPAPQIRAKVEATKRRMEEERATRARGDGADDDEDEEAAAAALASILRASLGMDRSVGSAEHGWLAVCGAWTASSVCCMGGSCSLGHGAGSQASLSVGSVKCVG